jgi:hypothetical protein
MQKVVGVVWAPTAKLSLHAFVRVLVMQESGLFHCHHLELI